MAVGETPLAANARDLEVSRRLWKPSERLTPMG